MHRQAAELVSIGHAATTLGVSVDTLRRWEHDGRAAFVRRGGKRWMAAAELARLQRRRGARNGARVNTYDVVIGAIETRDASVDLDLELGPHVLRSTISRSVADGLGLRPDDVVRIVINPSDVSVEPAG